MKVTSLTASLTALTLSNTDCVLQLNREGKITILVHFNQTPLVVRVRSTLVIFCAGFWGVFLFACFLLFVFCFPQYAPPLSVAGEMFLSLPPLCIVTKEGSGGDAAYC